MPENTVVTLRLEPELRKRLDGLAQAQRRSRSFIATEAIREYVAVNEWQIEETKKGLAEADRGEFASDAQVRRTMSKWKGPRRIAASRQFSVATRDEEPFHAAGIPVINPWTTAPEGKQGVVRPRPQGSKK